MENKRLKFSIVGLVVGYAIASPWVGVANSAQLTPDKITKEQVTKAAEVAIRSNTNAKACSQLLYTGDNKNALGYCVYWFYEANRSKNQPEIIAAKSFYLMTLDNLMKESQQ